MESEETQVPVLRDTSRIVRIVLLAVAVIYVIGSLYFIFETRARVASLEKAQQVAADKLNQRIALTDRDVKTSTEALAQKLGMTEQDLQARMAARAAELERQQRATEKRLTQQQKDQINQVTGEVAGVRTDLGSTKTDLASAKNDLEATKAKLERAIGDLGVQSGLIARTRDDLDELKKRGDKNYYEFSLQKGAHPTPISTVSLQLKKTDAKRSKFTLNVIADDRTIEKKDRTVSEPMQFYTGREHVLYELVVFTVDKNKVTGYLSTPKSVAAPVAK
jgi:chromosome segregation ATPase